jgi:hypothetical protein
MLKLGWTRNALVLYSIQTSEMTELWGIVVNEAMAASFQRAAVLAFRQTSVLSQGGGVL